MMDRRVTTLIFLAAVLILMVLLAASLSRLELKPAQGFKLSEPPSETPYLRVPGSSELLARLFNFLGIMALVSVPIYLFIHLRTPEGRRRLLVDVIYLSLISIALLLVFRSPREVEDVQPEETLEALPFAPGELPEALPLEEFNPQESPAWIDWAALTAVAVVVTGLLVGVIWYFKGREKPEPSLYGLIARQAQTAVEEIESGFDLRSAIIRCYVDMSKTLQKERNIHRDQDMTPREFERLLEARGVPGESVRRLTRLFEEVRYGNKQPARKDEQLAILCLNSIIDYCSSVQGVR